MTANTSFVAAQKDNVVHVCVMPRSVSNRRPSFWTRMGLKRPEQSNTPQDPNRKGLWVLRDGKPVPIAVSIGVTDGTYSENSCREIVQPGDLLITDMTAEPKRGLL